MAAACALAKMTHEYNTRGKKGIAVTINLWKSLEDNIISNINSLRNDFNSVKDVAIKKTPVTSRNINFQWVLKSLPMKI